jgi:predicted TIM-barrel fold metal-dependent hydrolase
MVSASDESNGHAVTSRTAIEAAERLQRHLETHAGQLVVDADTHITDVDSLHALPRHRYETTPDYYHGRPISAEDAILEMDMAGVDMALAWQNPATTVYGGSLDTNTRALTQANRYVLDSARRYPDRFIPAGWVDAKACGLDNTLELVEKLVVDFGFLIVKLNPAQNGYPINGPPSLAVVDRIVELGAVPAFHFGADSPFTPAEGLRCIAERYPERPLIAVHMGGGGAGYLEAEELYRVARVLGLEFPNIRYVFSAKRDTHIETDLIAYQLAGEPFCRHLFCGSDAPYGRMTWNFGGFRAMFQSLIAGAAHTDARVRARPGLFTQEAAQNYMGGNFARFVAGEYRRLLAAQQPCSLRCP